MKELQDKENVDGTSSWRCDQKDVGWVCKGRVKSNGVIVEILTQHVCAINPARVEVTCIR